MRSDDEILKEILNQFPIDMIVDYVKENISLKQFVEELDYDLEEIAKEHLDMIHVDDIEDMKNPHQSRGVFEGE